MEFSSNSRYQFSNKPHTSDSMNKKNENSTRMPVIDSLLLNKEKKNIFLKVETDPIWNPFGSPGKYQLIDQ